MNATAKNIQETLSVELMKAGYEMSEVPLLKLLKARKDLINFLYSKEMTEAGFNRAKSESDMIKAVADFMVSSEALQEAYATENQRLRLENQRLKERLSQKSIDLLLLKQSRRVAALNIAVDSLVLKMGEGS